MKQRFLMLSILLIFSLSLFSQKLSPKLSKVFENTYPNKSAPVDVIIDCNAIPANTCNYITNCNFTPESHYDPFYIENHYIRPFELGLVPNWYQAQGTPQLTDGDWDFATHTWIDPPTPAPAPATYYAHVSSTFYAGGTSLTEGIAQKIYPLTPGKKYLFSFFDKIKDYLGASTLDEFNVVLMHCSDNSIFSDPSISVPPNSQKILCQTNLSNQTWQRFLTTFTATDNFDMIWIFPKQKSVYPGLPFGWVGADIAYPELIDISSFSAGSTPVPTPGNCNVLIGPRVPNCNVANAVFTWHGPNSQNIVVTNPNDQRIQVNSNNPLEVGTWTLEMTVPNSQTPNGVCSQLAKVSATVTVPPCNPEIWPKVYQAQESNDLKIDKNGNLYMEATGMNMSNNLNHFGSINNTFGTYYVHYNKITGATNWVANDWGMNFTLNSGEVQIVNYLYQSSFKDGTSGNPSIGPIFLTSAERILAEDNGTFITISGQNLYVKLSGFTSTKPIPVFSGYNWTGYIERAIYNPTTRNLFLSIGYTHLGSYPSLLFVYNLSSSNVLTLINNPLLNQVKLAQVNTNEELFVYENGTIKKYNYLTNTNPAFSIVNFNNTSLEYVTPSNQIVEDKILVKNNSDHNFYCINTKLLTSKKLSFTTPSTSEFYSFYVFDGDDVYISGEYFGAGFSIGGQTLPLLGTQSAFITKFNISTDFTLKSTFEQSNSFQTTTKPIASINDFLDKDLSKGIKLKVSLSPNPARNSLIVNLNQQSNLKYSQYSISIDNALGINLFRKYITQNIFSIDVSRFEAGLYFVTIITNTGEKSTQLFMKE